MADADGDMQDALKIETEFLSGVEANLEAAKGRHFRGSIWQTARDDEVERLRAALAERRCSEPRARLRQTPHNRRVTLHGSERAWWFGRRRTGMATASVLSPLEHLAQDDAGAPPRITLAELQDHVRRIAGDGKVPHVIGVCAPTGFSDEARQGRIELPNVTLVLIEPGPRGGWQVLDASEGVPEYLRRIFDPEDANQKIQRVREVIAERSADLLTGGLSVSAVAERLDLPEHLVTEAFAREAATDPELRMSKSRGERLLYRGASEIKQERGAMDVFERIRQLFSGEGDEAQKINALAERRASLAQRRDRIYEDIGGLEKKESELLEEGKRTSSQVARRRLAAQLAQLRKDISRQNTTANMLNQQINILSTDIHNLTLIQQGEAAELPTTETLTENAVKAEELLETLKADAEMVGSLETGLSEVMTGDEELAILKEFEEADQAKAPPAEERASAPSARIAPVNESPIEEATPEPPAQAPEKKADPEAG
ncbi:MAG: hypothetical protein GY842_15580 [bacterium]|nr:hypothetical protein [bacterium]